jgi:hypothetical protein
MESSMVFPRTTTRERVRLPGALVLLLTLGLSGCDFHGGTFIIEPEFDDVSSFETDLEKWIGRATDLGTPEAAWEIVRSGDRATQGSGSSRLRLSNAAAQTRIFIQRRYEVERNQGYQVDISFDFASADWAGVIPPARWSRRGTPGTDARPTKGTSGCRSRSRWT